MSYRDWKSKLSMWTLVTSVLKKEQATIVLMDLLGRHQKAEKAVADLTAEELDTDTGLKSLLEKLDATFQAEKVDDAYTTYVNFNTYQKAPNISMND